METTKLLDIISTVRRAGAGTALAEMRRLDDQDHHETIAVFTVWAISRLVDAGLSDVGICWHPLTDRRSALAWWDRATLASDEARSTFISPDRALPGDPVPAGPSSDRELALAS
jgi:hypothetical protein